MVATTRAAAAALPRTKLLDLHAVLLQSSWQSFAQLNPAPAPQTPNTRQDVRSGVHARSRGALRAPGLLSSTSPLRACL